MAGSRGVDWKFDTLKWRGSKPPVVAPLESRNCARCGMTYEQYIERRESGNSEFKCPGKRPAKEVD